MGSNSRPAHKTLSFILFALLMTAVRAPAEESRRSRLPSSYSDFAISASTSLAGSEGMVRILPVDLAALPAGRGGIVSVTIENTYDEPIPITSARASCSCTQSKLLTNVIPARGEAQLEVLLLVPDSGVSADFEATVDLHVDMDNCKISTLRVISIRINYSVTGMLSFSEHSVMLGVLPGRSREISLPFVHSLKSPVEDLEINAVGFLRGIAGEVVPGNPISHIRLLLRAEDARTEGAYGSITISSGQSGPSDTINIVLFLESAVQISPRVLQFRSSDQALYATAVLHFSTAENPKSEENAIEDFQADRRDSRVPDSVFCEAFLHGKRLALEQQRLGRHVYRLKLRFDGDARELNSVVTESGGDRVIIWNVITDSRKETFRSLFSVPNSRGVDK